MTDASGPPQKILAVVNGRADLTTLQTAAALADRNGAALDIFACIEPPHDLDTLARLAGRASDRLLQDLCERQITEIRTELDACLPGKTVEIHQRVGKTFIEVIRHVIATGTDFVIKAAEPLTGVHRFLFTSTDQHLLRKCPCPVWLQTPKAKPVPGSILAAVDVDVWDAAEPETLMSLNRRAIDTARRVAAPTGAKVTVLHAWEAAGEGLVWAFTTTGNARTAADSYTNEILSARHKAMDDLMRDVASNDPASAGIDLRPRLVQGAPEQVIEEQSHVLSADVVVMGTVARTGLSGVFIGNTAENIINSLECPVLAVKPDGFVSPLA